MASRQFTVNNVLLAYYDKTSTSIAYLAPCQAFNVGHIVLSSNLVAEKLFLIHGEPFAAKVYRRHTMAFHFDSSSRTMASFQREPKFEVKQSGNGTFQSAVLDSLSASYKPNRAKAVNHGESSLVNSQHVGIL